MGGSATPPTCLFGNRWSHSMFLLLFCVTHGILTNCCWMSAHLWCAVWCTLRVFCSFPDCACMTFLFYIQMCDHEMWYCHSCTILYHQLTFPLVLCLYTSNSIMNVEHIYIYIIKDNGNLFKYFSFMSDKNIISQFGVHTQLTVCTNHVMYQVMFLSQVLIFLSKNVNCWHKSWE